MLGVGPGEMVLIMVRPWTALDGVEGLDLEGVVVFGVELEGRLALELRGFAAGMVATFALGGLPVL